MQTKKLTKKTSTKFKAKKTSTKFKAKKADSGTSSQLSPADNVKCDLSIHVYPLVLFFLQINIEFRVIFRSTCLDNIPLLQYFTLKWNHKEVLTPSDHPSFVYLDIFGRVFNFKFFDGYERGQFPDLNVAYKFVRVHPSNIISNINTFEESNVLLNPSDKNAQFTKRDIEKLKRISNPFFCSVIEKGTIMQCLVN